MKIEFARPLVLLLLPVLVGAVIFSMKYVYTATKTRKIFQIVMRSILALALLLALSGVSIKLTSKQTTTIFLVDVSDSVREHRDEAIRFVNDAVKERGANDSVAIIVFGSDAKVEQFITDTPVFNELQTDVNKTATNLEDAISMAVGMFPDSSAKRIVLITDGNENEGNVSNTISNVAAGGVKALALKLEENVSDEVYVSDIKIPDNIGTGETFNINVEIESNVATSATVSLYMGRTLKGQQHVQIQKGSNKFIFTDTQTDEGIKTYNVIVEADSDTITVNNEYSAFADIKTQVPVLLVEGAQGEADEIERIFDSIGVKYETVMSSNVPNTLSDLMNYSSVVFANVYEPELRSGFEDALKTFVKDYGGGFICTGGPDSYAVGGYKGTTLEEILPVYMSVDGNKVIPSLGFVMVIDYSGSMTVPVGFGTNATYLDLAKEAASAAVDTLQDEDYVGVIAFESNYSWTVPMGQVSATGREKINQGIYGISDNGGGTDIRPALEEGIRAAINNESEVRHVVLLTDGDDGTTQNNYTAMLENAKKNNVTVSTVAVGDGANVPLLQWIAEQCGGRMYQTSGDTDIPRIFAQEVILSSESYIRNNPFYPVVVSNSELVEGVGTDKQMEQLRAYVGTSPKETAISVLRTDQNEPLLSTWQYGLGRTVAWTSDFTGEWSASWAGSENSQKLWFNLINYVTDISSMDGAFAEVVQNGKHCELNYTTMEYSAKTGVTATITNEAGEVIEAELEPDSPGHYKTNFDMKDTGVYSISVKQAEDGEVVGNVNTAAIMQYSLEYRFSNAQGRLENYIAGVDGSMITEAKEVFAEKLELVKSSKDITIVLLILAAFLLLLDIAVRRFHWDLFGSIAEKHRARKAKKAAAAANRKKGGKKRKRKKKKTKAGAAGTPGNGASASQEGQPQADQPQDAKPENTVKEKPKKEKKKKDQPRQMLDPGALLKRDDEF